MSIKDQFDIKWFLFTFSLILNSSTIIDTLSPWNFLCQSKFISHPHSKSVGTSVEVSFHLTGFNINYKSHAKVLRPFKLNS